MTRRSSLVVPFLFAVTLVLPQTGHGGSTDLALFTAGSGSAPPNILIMLDSSGSMNDRPSGCWSCPRKRDTAEQALADLVTQVNPPDGNGGYIENVRFGLFVFGRGSSGYGSGRLLVPIADNNTAAMLASIPNTNETSVGTPLGVVLTDMGRYYAGDRGWGSLPVFGPAFDSTLEPSVPSPIDLECRPSFVIAMSDGLPNQDNPSKYGDNPSNPGSPAFCGTIGDADGDNEESICNQDDDWIDDVAHVMYRTDFAPEIPGLQNITVHTVGFDVDPQVLKDAAANGGGIYSTSSDYDSLVQAFVAVTRAIFDGLASFSGPAVPSSRTQGEGGFYYSYFKPNSSDGLWKGVLKAFGLNANGEIVDANGTVILSSGTGVIDPNTPGFWEAGTVLKSNSSRSLFTTKNGARTDFDSSFIDESDLALSSSEISTYPNYNAPGVAISTTSQLQDALVDYLHGKDAFDKDGDTNTGEMRDVVLGDIFHSGPILVGRPTTIHEVEDGFGPSATSDTFLYRYGLRDQVLYAGANDGMLHAFHAGTAGDNPATPGEIEADYYDHGTGQELFGYIPGILLPTIKMIPRNIPRTYYYVDGSPAVADVWLGATHDYANPKSADEWATVLVVGMREGGEGYLALDVTDPSATFGAHGPYPKLLWEFSHSNLGEAWSEPILTRVRIAGGSGLGDRCGHNDGDGDCREQWVAIFGGGYRPDGNPNDASYVDSPGSASWSNKGKGIFMVSLDTGQVIASATFDASDTSANGLGNMKYAFPSSPAVLDYDFDGFADVVYIGDLGGQVWKWDLSSVGSDSDSDGLVDNWPTGVFFRAYTASAWSSGPSHYHSRFYVIRDNYPTGPSAVGSVLYEDSLTDVTNPPASPDPADPGFFIRGQDGEKFVTEHIIFAGQVITTSYHPTSIAKSDPCAPGGKGTAFLHVFDVVSGVGFFADASAPTGQSRRITVGHGLPTAPNLSLSGDSGDRLFVKTSSGAVTAVTPPGSGAPPVSVIYWRQVF
jgi:type IV pilus assembly protein PilY1